MWGRGYLLVLLSPESQSSAYLQAGLTGVPEVLLSGCELGRGGFTFSSPGWFRWVSQGWFDPALEPLGHEQWVWFSTSKTEIIFKLRFLLNNSGLYFLCDHQEGTPKLLITIREEHLHSTYPKHLVIVTVNLVISHWVGSPVDRIQRSPKLCVILLHWKSRFLRPNLSW